MKLKELIKLFDTGIIIGSLVKDNTDWNPYCIVTKIDTLDDKEYKSVSEAKKDGNPENNIRIWGNWEKTKEEAVKYVSTYRWMFLTSCKLVR